MIDLRCRLGFHRDTITISPEERVIARTSFQGTVISQQYGHLHTEECERCHRKREYMLGGRSERVIAT